MPDSQGAHNQAQYRQNAIQQQQQQQQAVDKAGGVKSTDIGAIEHANIDARTGLPTSIPNNARAIQAYTAVEQNAIQGAIASQSLARQGDPGALKSVVSSPDFASNTDLQKSYTLGVLSKAGYDTRNVSDDQLQKIFNAWIAGQGATPNAKGGIDYTVNLSDTVGISDSATAGKAKTVNLSDKVGISDTVATKLISQIETPPPSVTGLSKLSDLIERNKNTGAEAKAQADQLNAVLLNLSQTKETTSKDLSSKISSLENNIPILEKNVQDAITAYSKYYQKNVNPLSEGGLTNWEAQPFENAIRGAQSSLETAKQQLADYKNQQSLLGNFFENASGFLSTQKNQYETIASQAESARSASSKNLENSIAMSNLFGVNALGAISKNTLEKSDALRAEEGLPSLEAVLGITQAPKTPGSIPANRGVNKTVNLNENLGISETPGKQAPTIPVTSSYAILGSPAVEGLLVGGATTSEKGLSGDIFLNANTLSETQKDIENYAKAGFKELKFKISGGQQTEEGTVSIEEALGTILGKANELGARTSKLSEIEQRQKPLDITISPVGFETSSKISNQKDYLEGLRGTIENFKSLGATEIKIGNETISLGDTTQAYRKAIQSITSQNKGSLANIDIVPMVEGKEATKGAPGSKNVTVSITENLGISDTTLAKNPDLYSIGVGGGKSIDIKTSNQELGSIIKGIDVAVAPITNIPKEIDNAISGNPEKNLVQSTALDELIAPIMSAGASGIKRTSEASIRPLSTLPTEIVESGKGFLASETVAGEKIVSNPVYYASQIPAEVLLFWTGGKAIDIAGKTIEKGAEVVQFAVRPGTNPKNIIATDFAKIRQGYEVKPAEEIVTPKNYYTTQNPEDILNKNLNENQVPEILRADTNKPSLENAKAVEESISQTITPKGVAKVTEQPFRLTEVGKTPEGEKIFSIEGEGINKPIFAKVSDDGKVLYRTYDVAPENAIPIINPDTIGVITKPLGKRTMQDLGLSSQNAKNTELNFVNKDIKAGDEFKTPEKTAQDLQSAGVIKPSFVERTFTSEALGKEPQRFFEYLANPRDINPPATALETRIIEQAKNIGLPELTEGEKALETGTRTAFYPKDLLKIETIKTEETETSKLTEFTPEEKSALGIKGRAPTEVVKDLWNTAKEFSATDFFKLNLKGEKGSMNLADFMKFKGFWKFPISPKATRKGFDFLRFDVKGIGKAPKTPNYEVGKKLSKEEAKKTRRPDEFTVAKQFTSTFEEDVNKFAGVTTKEGRQATIQEKREEISSAKARQQEREQRIKEGKKLKKDVERLIQFPEVSESDLATRYPLMTSSSFTEPKEEKASTKGTDERTLQKTFEKMNEEQRKATRRGSKTIIDTNIEQLYNQKFTTGGKTGEKGSQGSVLIHVPGEDIINIEDINKDIAIKPNIDTNVRTLSRIFQGTTSKQTTEQTPIVTETTVTETTQKQIPDQAFRFDLKTTQKEVTGEPVNIEQIFNPPEIPVPKGDVGGLEFPGAFGGGEPRPPAKFSTKFFRVWNVNPNEVLGFGKGGAGIYENVSSPEVEPFHFNEKSTTEKTGEVLISGINNVFNSNTSKKGRSKTSGKKGSGRKGSRKR